MGLFSSDHAKKLLHNKFILMLGDSVQRSCYKDLVLLLQETRVITDRELRKKGEDSFYNDTLVERSQLTNGTSYREVREFKTDHTLVRFYFVTRIYSAYMESILDDFADKKQPIPDVVVVNSCLWDITRYGKSNWKSEYQEKLEKFCRNLDELIPTETCVIWRTTLPVDVSIRGGFLTAEVANRNKTLLVDVYLANHLAHAVVTKHKYDVIDMHYMFTEQQRRRANDGVHWNKWAHRRMTNILLTHVSKAWDLGVPTHPKFSKETDFLLQDISMNTTDVLMHAYVNDNNNENDDIFRGYEDVYGEPVPQNNYSNNYHSHRYDMTSIEKKGYAKSKEYNSHYRSSSQHQSEQKHFTHQHDNRQYRKVQHGRKYRYQPYSGNRHHHHNY